MPERGSSITCYVARMKQLLPLGFLALAAAFVAGVRAGIREGEQREAAQHEWSARFHTPAERLARFQDPDRARRV